MNFHKLYQIINENTNLKIGFHNTSPENYELIKKQGLKINSKSYYTNQSNSWVKRAYGLIPVFISLQEDLYEEQGTVQLTVNIEGLKIAADLGTLIDYGAIIDENGFYFSKKGKAPEHLKALDEITYDELISGNLVNEFINLTKTLVVLENITPNRILKVDF